MLNLANINTHYGQAHILRDVSLNVPEGKVVALLGRNGAGKSTTLKTIIGMVNATSGTVHYNGQDIARLRNFERARLGIGYVPEERRVFRHLTVLENIITGEQPARPGRAPWTIERIFALFPKLDELKDRQGGQLSGGEQQMLTVARTLMTNPICLLLDEPTEGLAPIIVQQLTDAIDVLKKDGMAILLSEQNRHTAQKLADHIYVLEKGTLVYDGPLSGMTPQAAAAIGW